MSQIPIVAKLTDPEAVHLWAWIVGWRLEAGPDNCFPISIEQPYSVNRKGYPQLRGTVINEPNVLPSPPPAGTEAGQTKPVTVSRLNYKSIPAKGKARKDLPVHPWINKDTKFQLHHLVARCSLALTRTPTDKMIILPPPVVERLQKYFAEKGRYTEHIVDGKNVKVLPEWGLYELSHLCHNKFCTNLEHLVPEPSSTNKSRNYCPVVIRINRKFYWHCKHQPRCLLTVNAVESALKYTVREPVSLPVRHRRWNRDPRKRAQLYRRLSGNSRK